jgi:type II secretory ATPase GspE/PulE/Tfp pilus assembly ATPase PilB-like protein
MRASVPTLEERERSPFRDTAPMADATALNGFEDSFPEGMQVIRSISEFPPIKTVLTATDSSDMALRIPLELRDLLIAVQMDSRHGRIYVDPASQSKTLRHVPAILSGLSAIGISAGGKPHFADTKVIAAIRQSHEKSSERRGGSIGSKSAGAQLFREWIGIAHAEKATDLHIRVIDGGKAKVQIRVNGVLEDLPGTQHGLVTEGDALSSLKSAYEVLSDKHSNNTGTYSPTATLSSMIDANLGIPNLRIRYASIRGLYGPKGVMRLLPTSAIGAGMSFEQMGFAPAHIELFERSQTLESGGVGFLGVTGSGKTTAAKAYIDTHPRRHEIALYQVADPIEYPVADMHQIYVQRDLLELANAGQKDAYSVVIESLLRADPEMIDVGEVRDKLSARAMANTAKSGHLAMFTLHVGGIHGAINRLSDPAIGLSREELTAGDLLALLCYQSLVPVLCKHCAFDLSAMQKHLKEQFRAEAQREAREVSEVVKQLTSRFGFDHQMLRFRNPCGCEHCKGRGTAGLTIVAEVLMPEPGWLDLAASHQDREAALWWRRKYSDRDVFSGDQNGKLVIEHAMYKASLGLIDPRRIQAYGQLQALEVV